MIDLPEGKLFVGGEWEEGTGPEITSIFPADGTVNRVLRGASLPLPLQPPKQPIDQRALKKVSRHHMLITW